MGAGEVPAGPGLQVGPVLAALDRARVDAVAGGEQAHGDHNEEEDQSCHVLIVPYFSYQRNCL